MPKSRKMVKFRIWDKVSEGNILIFGETRSPLQ